MSMQANICIQNKLCRRKISVSTHLSEKKSKRESFPEKPNHMSQNILTQFLLIMDFKKTHRKPTIATPTPRLLGKATKGVWTPAGSPGRRRRGPRTPAVGTVDRRSSAPPAPPRSAGRRMPYAGAQPPTPPSKNFEEETAKLLPVWVKTVVLRSILVNVFKKGNDVCVFV